MWHAIALCGWAAQAAPPAWVAEAPSSGATLRLLEAGRAPAPARYGAEVGQTARVTVTLDLSMTMTLDGATLPAGGLPRQDVHLDLTVTAASADAWTWTATVAGVSVGPVAPGPPQAGPLDALVGSVLTLSADRRGQVTGSSADPAPGLSGAGLEHLGRIEEATALLLPPLPEAPVGVGGSWEVLRRAAPGGFPVVERQVWRLEERAGDRLVLERASTQVIAGDDVQMAGLPAGSEAAVASFRSEGLGRWTQRLDAVAPDVAAWATDLDAQVDVTLPGQGAHRLGVALSARMGAAQGPPR